MVGTTNFPGGLDSHVLGDPFGFSELVNGLQTYLTAALSASATTITVASNVGFPERGIVVLGTSLETSEVVTYTGLSGTTQFTGCTRGAGSTTARIHPVGALAVSQLTAARLNDQAAAIVALETQARTYGRDDFLADLVKILGDCRLLWLPKSTDATTSTDESLNGRTITWDATVAARLSALGLGYAQSFSGSGQYGSVADAANLTFSSGGVDQAMSIVALCNVTDTAADRPIISKWNFPTAGEWLFYVNASDKLQFWALDNSAVGIGHRESNAVVTMGSWRLFGVSYSGVGGASVATGMTLYQDGAVIASTATLIPTYTSMDDTAAVVEIGGTTTHTSVMNGSMALVALVQKNLSAADHWALKRLVNAYFNLSL